MLNQLIFKAFNENNVEPGSCTKMASISGNWDGVCNVKTNSKKCPLRLNQVTE